MKRFLSSAILLVFACPVWGEIDVGSDGSDGAFSPTVNTAIDLSLAASMCACDPDGIVDDPCRWDCPSPVEGQGVYDADQWAVVFKYSSVNIPASVTVTFSNHPSRAPVVWLVQTNVVIDGAINVNGICGHSRSLSRSYAEPGPGGFRGGRGSNIASGSSGGSGPGGGPPGPGFRHGGGGSYATTGVAACTGAPLGPTYGNAAILPLIGGSGGEGARVVRMVPAVVVEVGRSSSLLTSRSA